MRRVAATSRAAGSALLVALASLVMLSGCVPDDSPPTPPQTTATAAPVFASEEEALAAATEAYRNYQTTVDTALKNVADDGLESAAVGVALDVARSSVEEFRTKGIHQTGDSVVYKEQLVTAGSLLTSSASTDPVQIYACLDVSATNVLNAAGESQLELDAVRIFPMVVTLSWQSELSVLLVEEEEVWDAQDFCH